MSNLVMIGYTGFKVTGEAASYSLPQDKYKLLFYTKNHEIIKTVLSL